MASPLGKSANHEAPSHLLRAPPSPLPAVRLRLVSPAVGYGLFAARDLAADEFIFHEAPLLTALFNEKFAADRALVQSQAASYRAALAAHRDVVAAAYPGLAARAAGVVPGGYEEVMRVLREGGGLGMNLVGGTVGKGEGVGKQYAGAEVSREEYEAFVAGLKVPSAGVTEADTREACLDFFKHYAFQVPASNSTTGGASGGGGGGGGAGGGAAGGTSGNAMVGAASTGEACIYLLGSLINHCCTPPPATTTSKRKKNGETGPNCTWRIGPSGLAHFVKPRHICVQARRAIREGEQLTWDYGKREKGFDCECETCRERRLSGICSLM
ncbi:hypothetical protein B0J18DRAFT_408013 [Chaetomium sp. MPI-SDFR-AT-0129]|nr:hypothetical protein B0J18DRAFT_408013 [Chaetomium sp. MPI-SDFR-AT-0129]